MYDRKLKMKMTEKNRHRTGMWRLFIMVAYTAAPDSVSISGFLPGNQQLYAPRY